MTTAQMVTLVRTRMGEDSTTATQISDAQILDLLNERMAELCADTNALVSGWVASTVNGQQQYSVPPEYTTVEAIRLYRTSGDNAQTWLKKISLVETDARAITGTPSRFAVWGLNVSGDNSPAFWLDPVPNANGSSDLFCYGRQLPKTMVSGGQNPEVRLREQYTVVSGALALVYYRFSEGSPVCLSLAERAEVMWQKGMDRAAEYAALEAYSPQEARDTAGYTR